MSDYEAERHEISQQLDYTPGSGETLRPSELVPILNDWAYCGYIHEDHVPEILGQLCLWIEGYEHHRAGWYLLGRYRGRNDWMDVVEAVTREVKRRPTTR
ncbi:hypothetical protein [Nesterenkonia sp. F]|uniref:hypothetical protein n=1 Tax=Nesterenkonia sp. F TaxID=795955 RepID=UPI000255CD3A|nr:hypothetical protein [Nesterenkonia sp. F]